MEKTDDGLHRAALIAKANQMRITGRNSIGFFVQRPNPAKPGEPYSEAERALDKKIGNPRPNTLAEISAKLFAKRVADIQNGKK
ncbi:MAG: hypothetical protein ABIH35_02480 [Patescibacteria group bacterium]